MVVDTPVMAAAMVVPVAAVVAVPVDMAATVATAALRAAHTAPPALPEEVAATVPVAEVGAQLDPAYAAAGVAAALVSWAVEQAAQAVQVGFILAAEVPPAEGVEGAQAAEVVLVVLVGVSVEELAALMAVEALRVLYAQPVLPVGALAEKAAGEAQFALFGPVLHAHSQQLARVISDGVVYSNPRRTALRASDF